MEKFVSETPITIALDPVIIAVDQGNYNVKSFGQGNPTEPFPTGVNHHGDVPPPIMAGSLGVNGQYYSITQDRLQTRRDKTEDEDYYVLTLAAIATELRALYPNADSYDVKIALGLGLPVEHLSLKTNDGQLLRDRYRGFFGNNGQPIEYVFEGIQCKIEVVDVGVFAQTISAALSDMKVWQRMMKSARSYIVDIGGGTTNVVSIINQKPQNPGITLEDMGVLELFKMAHRAVLEDTGRNIDDFMLDVILRGEQTCTPAIKAAIERAKTEFVKKLILELQSRKVDLYMGFLCFVGGGSVLLYDCLRENIENVGNDQMTIIPDVRANAKGYYAQESIRLKDVQARKV